MYSHIGQCAHCNNQFAINLGQLARQAVRLACPLCGTVAEYAEHQVAQPGISAEAKQIWTVVGLAAFCLGLAIFVDNVT